MQRGNGIARFTTRPAIKTFLCRHKNFPPHSSSSLNDQKRERKIFFRQKTFNKIGEEKNFFRKCHAWWREETKRNDEFPSDDIHRRRNDNELDDGSLSVSPFRKHIKGNVVLEEERFA